MVLDHFEKHNTTRFADALLKEAEGLRALQEIISVYLIEEIRIPEIISVSETLLVLEHIPAHTSKPTPRLNQNQMAQLGTGLAKLHQYSTDKGSRFGLAHDNYIGLNPQENSWSDNWGEFFVKHRLSYQINLIKNDAVKTKFEVCLSNVREQLVGYLNSNCAGPSLCHGDLWSGNAMFSKEYCWLIDPAVYYGDREVDLAMTEMFGGFHSCFYKAYDKILPRSLTYENKKQIYNLYHYLNHYNLFGNSYLSVCERFFSCLPDLIGE